MKKELSPLVFDLETDGFNPTKIHVLSCCYLDKGGNWSMKSTSDYDEMRKFFSSEDSYFIGYNSIRYDIPTAERLLGIKIPKSSKSIDLLAISWYIFHDRKEHNLDSWGVTIGIPKIEINDDEWEGLPIERYIERCESDVKITTNVWVRCFQKLLELYGTPEKAYRLIDYLSNKMYAAHLQEVSRWKLDVDLCKKNYTFLLNELEEKSRELQAIMPPISQKKILKKPSSLYLKSGKLSQAGNEWLTTLKEFGYPVDHEGDIEVIRSFKAANAQSSDQRKAFLFGLGWKPITFKYVENPDGTKREIPQILKQDKSLCESVLELAEQYPEVLLLEKLGSLVQRTAMLKRWLKDVSEDGYLTASIAGFTSTLRFIHSGLLNIPKNSANYGEFVRSCLIAKDSEHELVGADLCSLETYTKLSMIWPHDHRYVKDELSDDFDGNLSLALCSGAITDDESKFYKWYKSQK